MIRLGVLADLPAATHAYSSASLSNTGDRDNLLAQPEHLILGPEGLAQGRTYVAEEDGSLVGFATRIEADGTIELEDLFVHPRSMRRGIATALVDRIAEVLRARGVERPQVTANPHALGSAAPLASSTAAPPRRTLAPRLAWCWRSADRPLGDQAATRRQQRRTSQLRCGEDMAPYPDPLIGLTCMCGRPQAPAAARRRAKRTDMDGCQRHRTRSSDRP